jgi:hypothetical protein
MVFDHKKNFTKNLWETMDFIKKALDDVYNIDELLLLDFAKLVDSVLLLRLLFLD